MKPDSLKWLFDISHAIGEIIDFIRVNKVASFSDYSQNKLLKRAVERNLAIVGEAMNKIKWTDPDLFASVRHARSIVALRNHIVHAYDNISDENIWSILINHLPKLNVEVAELLDKYPSANN